MVAPRPLDLAIGSEDHGVTAVDTLDHIAAAHLDQDLAHARILSGAGPRLVRRYRAFMRAVIQRVDGAEVVVAGETVGHIVGPGLLLLVGVTHTDDESTARRLAQKAYDLRIFDASRFEACTVPGGPREVSASDLGLPVLVVSQFTLYADTRKGRRPTWDAAAPGPVAEPLVAVVADELQSRGARVATGRFGADMRVGLVNDGPTTIIMDVE